MKHKKILFGANGYLGSHLAHFINNDPCKKLDISGSVSPEITSQHFDITNRASFHDLDLDVDTIYFFSGKTGTEAGFYEYENYTNINQIGLNHLLDEMVKQNSKARVIFPSTRLIYGGIKDTPLKEEDAKVPLTIYALNKLSAENLLKIYANRFDLKYTIFRICVPYGNLIGSRQSYGTIGFFLSKALKKENIVIYGDGTQKRTFTHVEDLCHIILEASQSPKTINNILNIGGNTHSIKEVAGYIAKKYGVQIEHTPFPDTSMRLESGDTIFNDSKLMGKIQYQYLHNIISWLDQQY